MKCRSLAKKKKKTEDKLYAGREIWDMKKQRIRINWSLGFAENIDRIVIDEQNLRLIMIFSVYNNSSPE